MYDDLSKYDVFNASLLVGADYAGDLEFPVIRPTSYIPTGLEPFTHARAHRAGLERKCIHFFEHDVKFRCVWRTPWRYLELFKSAEGVIGPDFSMYRNMPEAMQMWDCFKSRAITYWLQREEVETIPNVRVFDERCLPWVFKGPPRHSVVAISTAGCCKHPDDRAHLKMAVGATLESLSPTAIIVNGSAPDEIFGAARVAGVQVVAFEDQFSKTHRKAASHGHR